jgi:hypothetical protein
MCDKLVFDLSQEVEGTPNVFIRKDWINILDNMNQNYGSNQSIIDTSQLSNSNKWMSYRESYFSIPLSLNLITPGQGASNYMASNAQDFCIGLKNWFGSIIHSFTVDYNGTTIVQQTPFINMWNSFKLLTSLSYQDVESQGATIGFYHDTPDSHFWGGSSANINGVGICNNVNTISLSRGGKSSGECYGSAFQSGAAGGNAGLQRRILNINFDPTATALTASGQASTYSTVGISTTSCNQTWRGYISQQLNPANATGIKQIAVVATVYLKHVHSFFNMIPLLKGVFMKITMNLNNSDCVVTTTSSATMSLTSSTVPVGGVQMLMVPSLQAGLPSAVFSATAGVGAGNGALTYSLSVGKSNLSATARTAYTAGTIPDTPLSGSIYLYVPAYTFNPTFEEAYLSSSPKIIRYSDVYQYQVQTVGAGQPFNQLITNGLAGIKSVLIIPFYAPTTAANGLPAGTNTWLSPFDPAGCGTTSPLITLGNFNVQISGQNAIYNMQRYSFEEFNNQLYGQNAVNGGLTDGLTSGLIDFRDFSQSYCYHYVNVERMLPVEKTVPKSVQIIGQNYSTQDLTFIVFVEYDAEIKVDLYTGARI